MPGGEAELSPLHERGGLSPAGCHRASPGANIRGSAATLIDVTVPSQNGRVRRNGIRIHRSGRLGGRAANQRGSVLGYEVDAFWPDANLIVELDGYAAHSTRRAFQADRERDARLIGAGFSAPSA